MNFAIPINYVSGLLNELHEPMSLEQMRTNLGVKSAAGGASLNETLGWLKEKLPLASNHHVIHFPELLGADRTKDVTFRTTPVRFDSCTVVFDFTEASDNHFGPPSVATTRFTVPLGASTGGDIRTEDIVLSVPETPESEKLETWVVDLDAMSKGVHWETHEDPSNTTATSSQNFAFITFFDESVATRVLNAFKHAADLCRSKEPF